MDRRKTKSNIEKEIHKSETCFISLFIHQKDKNAAEVEHMFYFYQLVNLRFYVSIGENLVPIFILTH